MRVSVHACFCKTVLMDYIYLSSCPQISNLHHVSSSNLTLRLDMMTRAHWESLSDRHDTEKQKEDLDRDRDRNRDAVEL